MDTNQQNLSIEQRVYKVVADRLCLEGNDANLKPDTTFDELQADSLDMAELAIALEEEFECELPDEEADKLETVGDAVKYFTGALAK